MNGPKIRARKEKLKEKHKEILELKNTNLKFKKKVTGRTEQQIKDLIGVQEGEERKNGAEKILTMAENFTEVMTSKSHIQKTKKTTSSINIKEKPIPNYIIVAYLRTKCNEKNLESSQRKTTKYKGNNKNDSQLYVTISVIELNINGLDIQTTETARQIYKSERKPKPQYW